MKVLPYCIYRANNDYNIANKIVTIIIIIIITITTAIRIGIRNKNKIKNKDIRFCLFRIKILGIPSIFSPQWWVQ